MEEIKVSEMLQADSINKDDSVMIIQEGVNKKASGSIQTATGNSLSLTSVADTCKVKSNSVNLFDKDTAPTQAWIFDTPNMKIVTSANGKCTYIPCKPSTTYTISRIADIRFQIATTEETPNTNVAISNYGENNTGTTMRITTNTSAKYLVIYYWHNSSSITEQAVLDTLQIEEGSTATTYNPYNTKVIIADGDVSSPTIEAGTIQQATGQNATGSRMRSAGYIDVEPNKEYTLYAGGNTAVVFEYKADNTYIHRIPDNWIKTPYTFTTTSETARVRFVTESPNVTQNQIVFQEGSKRQEVILTPQEEKLVFTYNTKTGVLSNGSITIEYNTQSRVLNNDDTTAIKEYVNTKINILTEDVYVASSTSTGTTSLQFPDISKYKYIDIFYSNTTGTMGNVVRLEPRIAIGKNFVIASNSTASNNATIYLNMNRYTLTATSITFLRRTEKTIDTDNTITGITSTTETNISINRIIGYK